MTFMDAVCRPGGAGRPGADYTSRPLLLLTEGLVAVNRKPLLLLTEPGGDQARQGADLWYLGPRFVLPSPLPITTHIDNERSQE